MVLKIENWLISKVEEIKIFQNKTIMTILVFLPLVAFFPTWLGAFTAENIDVLKQSQWWLFIPANIAGYALIGKKGSIIMRSIYLMWTLLVLTLQIAIWVRIFYNI